MAARLLDQFDVSEEAIRRIVADSVSGADDGELFVEYREGEALVFDNGRLKTASFNADRGFGLRAVAGETTGYAHSGELSQAALKRAASAVSAIGHGHAGVLADAPAGTNRRLYGEDNPIAEPGFEAKVGLLQEIDAFLRGRDPRVRQVTASLAASWQQVEIMRADGRVASDVRPLVRFSVAVVVGEGELRAGLERSRDDLGIPPDTLRFLGGRNDVPRLMAAADAYLMSSAWEGLPMVLLEAAASALPIVATDVGGNRDIVIDGRTGRLVAAHDPTALQSAMAEVMSMAPPLRAAWGEAGRDLVRERYELGQVVDRWEALYHTLLAERL